MLFCDVRIFVALEDSHGWSYSTGLEVDLEVVYYGKCKVLIWLIMHNALPTNDFRVVRGLASSQTCSRCFLEEETQLHCLRKCVKAKEVWQLVEGFVDYGLQLEDMC